MEEIKETQVITQSRLTERSRAQKHTSVIVLALLTMFFLASIFYRASDVGPDGQYFTICAFKNIVGLPCPGCGLAHSFCALGKGRLVEAFRFNLLGPVVYFLFILIWLRSLSVLSGWRRPVMWMDRAASRLKLIPVFVVMFAVLGLGRILYLLLAR